MDIDSENLPRDAGALDLSAFNASFPLPYRVLLLAGAGIACWVTNLHILYLLGIDTAFALDIRRDNKPSPQSPPSMSTAARQPPPGPLNFNSFAHPATLYPPVYKLLITYTAWISVGWIAFRLATRGDAELMDDYKIFPIITTLGALFALLCPFNLFQKRERTIFLQCVRRCLVSPLDQPIHFSDVIFADIFTSYAKVIGDMWISACCLWPGGSLVRLPELEGFSSFVVPLLMSLPYFVRFRQCIVEYLASKQQSSRSLFNAVKYATAFPVIFLSAAQRLVVIQPMDNEMSAESAQGVVWHGEYRLFRLWLLAVFINSAYSFWWDVTNDWGFDILLPSSRKHHTHSPRGHPEPRVGKLISATSTPSGGVSTPLPLVQPMELQPSPEDPNSYPYGLRRVLLYRDPIVYYIAIILNLILRFIWSLKLSTHLHSIAELESGIFLMEALELIRRWMWVFVRVEWEVIKKGHVDGRAGGDLRGANELELMLFHEDSTADEKQPGRVR
ncbi:hypothetical protein BOTBODRAFT_150872 [Botryobasidium botryosum FD-172 SS1]|uniref:EXS domain-containing protein n=1 Tax=Botryobasidium botryosum (strain FD-172 SS1) TaxID=930990 RepID=A0A067NDN6_BOTB1|nr:hypothetical protein BOTBODRAFT_150872 [Botryobasidium botryosum FD-172 SS1]